MTLPKKLNRPVFVGSYVRVQRCRFNPSYSRLVKAGAKYWATWAKRKRMTVPSLPKIDMSISLRGKR